MNNDSQNLWDWPAFGYVNGEMTDEERRLFEQRLAEDEVACDAVVRAVELREAIRLASSECSVVRRSTPNVGVRHTALWATMIAACLVLAVSVWRFASVVPSSNDDSAKSDVRYQQAPSGVEPGVSLLWAELQSREANPVNDDSDLSIFDSTTVSHVDDTQSDMETVDTAETTVPQWLLTAVSSGNVEVKEIP